MLKIKKFIQKKSFLWLTSTLGLVGLASATTATTVESSSHVPKHVVKKMLAFSQYHENYFLPFWYTQMPNQAIYAHDTPDGQAIARQEVKFQISFKTYVWPNMFHEPISLLIAYTQKSFWQLYQGSAFFRETNYQPEFFFHMDAQKSHFLSPVLPSHLQIIDLGFMHQSNGDGGTLERSWNRLYFRFKFKWTHFKFTLMPWYVFHGNTLERYNPDITRYLGHGKWTMGVHFGDFCGYLTGRNNLESGFKRGALQLTLTYPLSSAISIFVQGFAGFGQSLIEYNHYTNAVGVGIALAHPF